VSGASASTATATIATASDPTAYVGRFAPSPTGALHLGSLLAAVGSFLDARRRGGRWLVRMEDLDAPRVLPGCAANMLRTLEAFGLSWDGAVEYQSAHLARYAAALDRLSCLGLTFQCSCSRRERLGAGGYPGTCRAGPTRRGPTATRLRVADAEVCFEDRVQGGCRFSLRERGDVIVRRRDGAFAYQLAVVVDDAAQGITDVVRGADLLDSTPWQMALQEALGLAVPRYAHLPLVVEPGGGKLAKSRRSVALDATAVTVQMHRALQLLGQDPPAELKLTPVGELLTWAVSHWSLEGIQGVRQVRA
jgi:glutamyl-Q tRNA(Asp) synthetase